MQPVSGSVARTAAEAPKTSGGFAGALGHDASLAMAESHEPALSTAELPAMPPEVTLAGSGAVDAAVTQLAGASAAAEPTAFVSAPAQDGAAPTGQLPPESSPVESAAIVDQPAAVDDGRPAPGVSDSVRIVAREDSRPAAAAAAVLATVVEHGDARKKSVRAAVPATAASPGNDSGVAAASRVVPPDAAAPGAEAAALSGGHHSQRALCPLPTFACSRRAIVHNILLNSLRLASASTSACCAGACLSRGARPTHSPSHLI